MRPGKGGGGGGGGCMQNECEIFPFLAEKALVILGVTIIPWKMASLLFSNRPIKNSLHVA